MDENFNMMHRKNKKTLFTEHFNADSHTLADMTVVAIDQINSHDPRLNQNGKAGGSGT